LGAWTFQKLGSVRTADAEMNQNTAASRESERRLLSEQPDLEISISNTFEILSLQTAKTQSPRSQVDVAQSDVRNLQVVFYKASLTIGRVQEV
jgi:hypothetical protein